VNNSTTSVAYAGVIGAILAGVVSLLSSGVLGAYKLMYDTRNLLLNVGATIDLETRRHIFESDWRWLWMGYSVGIGFFAAVFGILAIIFSSMRPTKGSDRAARRVWRGLVLICVMACIGFALAAMANAVIGYREYVYLKQVLY